MTASSCDPCVCAQRINNNETVTGGQRSETPASTVSATTTNACWTSARVARPSRQEPSPSPSAGMSCLLVRLLFESRPPHYRSSFFLRAVGKCFVYTFLTESFLSFSHGILAF